MAEPTSMQFSRMIDYLPWLPQATFKIRTEIGLLCRSTNYILLTIFHYENCPSDFFYIL